MLCMGALVSRATIHPRIVRVQIKSLRKTPVSDEMFQPGS
jgi:hypothetical protein